MSNHRIAIAFRVGRACVFAPTLALLDSFATLDTFARIAFDHTHTKSGVRCSRRIDHLRLTPILFSHSRLRSLLESRFFLSVQSGFDLIRLDGITS
jgi:hypothetical protein